jgi:RNA polymerase sigma factor (sigma-70 family)
MSEVFKGFRTVLLQGAPGLTDGELLEAFVRRRDHAALAALVGRHGPLVWGVCRRLLAHEQDAEDAFQATFLILVRKADGIRHPELVANWLHGVARHTARKARALADRRRQRERQVLDMPEPVAPASAADNDLRSLLDRELGRLPDKYRILILLCDLEGKTRKEVARQLGCPEGTVAGRLARARALLARRLARLGRDLAGAAPAALLAPGAASAAVPPPLVSWTVDAATAVAAGKAVAAVVSPTVAALTEGVLTAMLHSKLKAAVAVLMGLTACACMALAATQPAGSEPPRDDPKVSPGKVEQAGGKPAAADAQALEAWWQDLASKDDARASRALLAFSARPRESVAFFKEHLKPVKLDTDRLKKLIGELDDEKFPVREAAAKQLVAEVEYQGQPARAVLEQYLKGDGTLEFKSRLRKVLEKFPSTAKQGTDPTAPSNFNRYGSATTSPNVAPTFKGAANSLPATPKESKPVPGTLTPPSGVAPAGSSTKPGGAGTPVPVYGAPAGVVRTSGFPQAPGNGAPAVVQTTSGLPLAPANNGFGTTPTAPGTVTSGGTNFSTLPAGKSPGGYGSTYSPNALASGPPAPPPGPSGAWLRAVRAVALLESIGTAEARSILESLAAGEADALPTQEARAALERLSGAK